MTDFSCKLVEHPSARLTLMISWGAKVGGDYLLAQLLSNALAGSCWCRSQRPAPLCSQSQKSPHGGTPQALRCWSTWGHTGPRMTRRISLARE